MKNYFKVVSALFLVSIIVCSCSGVYARNNYAYAAGLTYNRTGNIFNMDSYNICSNAITAYQNAGYSVAGHINPGKTLLWTNLYATVQFFAGHGGVNHMNFTTTGIHNGGDYNGTVTAGSDTFSVDMIGTNRVNWYADTILVTYSACQCAGTNGNVASDSVARSTAVRGTDVVFGFTDEVQDGSKENWSNRYNQKLGQGYGVLDAVNYANSFSYIFSSVKNNTLWHHGDSNMKIGFYGNSPKNILARKIELSERLGQYNKNSIIIDNNSKIESNTLKDKSMEERNVLKNKDIIAASKENIVKELKNINNKFNENNYIIEKYNSSAYNVETNNITDENTYYEYKLKIGDFITNAAYTVVVKNGKINAIYDNNIDLNKQEKLLENENLFRVSNQNNNISKLDTITKQCINDKYNSNLTIADKKYTYYYDIENDKKYIVSSFTTEMQIDGLERSIAIDNCKYEIN